MKKENKLALGLAVGYATIAFNTIGFKYHHPGPPSPDVRSADVVESDRAVSAGFCGMLWPLYWPIRWSVLFWEPRPATNVVYVTNYVERPYRQWFVPYSEVRTNEWQEYWDRTRDSVITAPNSTNYIATNYIATNYINWSQGGRTLITNVTIRAH